MEKTKLEIKLFPDPVLHKKSKPVKQITEGYRKLLSQMAQLMYDSSGIGLAAPQVGVSENLIVVDCGSGLYKLINPKIIKKQGRQILQEGCLSIPGVCINVKRAKKVWVEALDEIGKSVNIQAEGVLACVFQHEIEHLEGKLIIEHASLLEKIKIKNKLKALKKKRLSELCFCQKSSGPAARKEERFDKLSEPETKSCKLQL